MADKTPTEKTAELTARIRDLEGALEKHQLVTDLALKTVQAQLADRVRTESELRRAITDLTVKNAALEERARHQEKNADRGWQLWLAILGFGFGLFGLLVIAVF